MTNTWTAIDDSIPETPANGVIGIDVSAHGVLGTSDDAATFQAALNAAGATANGVFGAAVRVPANMSFTVGSLTIPAGVSLVGPYENVMQATAAGISNMAGVLRLNAGATITLGDGAGICGFPIVKHGMTFPQTFTQASFWTDTAITLNGVGAHIKRCAIIGFRQGILATKSHVVIDDVTMDCWNGLDFSASFDVSYISKLRCETYASIGTGVENDERRNTGIYIHDTAVGTILDNCFTFGQLAGLKITNADSVTVKTFWADNVTIAGNPQGPVGIFLDGFGTNTKLIGCRMSAQDIGVYINRTSATGYLDVQITDLETHTMRSRGILVDNGNFSVVGGAISDVPSGITVNNTSSIGLIDNVTFNANVYTYGVELTADNKKICLGKGNLYLGPGTAYQGFDMPTIASAGTILPDPYWDTMYVSGSSAITAVSVASSLPGRIISLTFLGTPTLTSSAALRLRGGTNYTAAAGDTLTLRLGGSGDWREAR